MTIEEKRELIHELYEKYQESINQKDKWKERLNLEGQDNECIFWRYKYFLGESEGLKMAIQIIDKTLEQINK